MSGYATQAMAVQVDTSNILFICGGAFIDLDRQVAERTASASIGFGNPVRWGAAVLHRFSLGLWLLGCRIFGVERRRRRVLRCSLFSFRLWAYVCMMMRRVEDRWQIKIYTGGMQLPLGSAGMGQTPPTGFGLFAVWLYRHLPPGVCQRVLPPMRPIFQRVIVYQPYPQSIFAGLDYCNICCGYLALTSLPSAYESLPFHARWPLDIVIEGHSAQFRLSGLPVWRGTKRSMGRSVDGSLVTVFDMRKLRAYRGFVRLTWVCCLLPTSVIIQTKTGA